MEYFNDKVVIITGGAAGIGKAASHNFAHHGATVIMLDINKEAGESLEDELLSLNLKAKYIYCNTADSTEVDHVFASVVNTYKTIDILINNAGITRDSTLKKMTNEDWQSVIDVNLSGVFYCARAVARVMLEQGSGRIINVSSVVGLYGNFGQTNYAATKAGVIGMTKTLAKELGRKGINVNAVAPGFIATEMVKKMPDKVIQMMIDKIPNGRLGTPEDIANTFLFLSGPEAAYINGTTISVDGGVTL